MWNKIVFYMLALVSVECLQYQYIDDGLGDLSWYGKDLTWPLAVLEDRKYFLSRDMSRIPLLAVPSHDMALISRPHISAYSPDSNLVTCQLNKFSMEAMPAVKIVLPLPILLAGDEGYLRFPSHLNVEAQGIRFMMPVGALIAPVSEQPYNPYHLLNVVYAVPSFTFREPLPLPHYPSFIPSISFDKPSEVTTEKVDDKQTTTPIRVLEFPSKISTPSALEKPDQDEELVNRGPPEEQVVPAGLVQSTQPHSLLTNFVNSKESPLLQSFRDEANKHRDFNAKPAVEAL